MRFWDSSAILPLLVRDSHTESKTELLTDDPVVAVWWGSRVECHSALARLSRDGRLTAGGWELASARLAEAVESWAEVPPVARVREQALRMLRVHPLRAADALQLAAAMVCADFEPGTLDFVTLDDRLGKAAAQEGFSVIA